MTLAFIVCLVAMELQTTSTHDLTQLLAGQATLADFVDERLGVVMIEATDFSNDAGVTRSSSLLCGAQLTSALPALETSLSSYCRSEQSFVKKQLQRWQTTTCSSRRARKW